jgi:hypothetical protein
LEVESNKQRRVNALCAVIAASAVATMGILAVAQDQERTGTTASPSMNVGQTTTEASVPASVVATPVARPTLKAQRPNGF